jgi:serine/threonine-protein kinase
VPFSHSVLGNSFGKYRLIAELGRGGMATVYLAASGGPGGFNKLSVLKLLRVQEQDGVELFLEEARLAAQLNHPNVVQTYEVGKVGAQYFIAMEFIDGPALNRLRRRVPVPLPIGLHVVSGVLEGLRYAHALRGYDGSALGLVHRDLSPQNVLVTYEGDCKIVDFGIAKALDSPPVTGEGLFRGKLTYMPPEQARGGHVDQRADVFAVGVLLFETLSGRRLWQGDSELVVMQRLLSGDVPRLEGHLPEVSSELLDLCHWALAPEPELRCPSAEALHLGLEAHLRSAGLGASRRELGELVASTFSADRERLQRVIAAQLQEGALPAGEPVGSAIPHASYGSSSSSLDEASAEQSVDLGLAGLEDAVTRAVPDPAVPAGALGPGAVQRSPLRRRALQLAVAAALLASVGVLAGAALEPRAPAAPPERAAPSRPAAPAAPSEVQAEARLPGARALPEARAVSEAALPTAVEGALGAGPGATPAPAGATAGGRSPPGSPAPDSASPGRPASPPSPRGEAAPPRPRRPAPSSPAKDDAPPDELGF